MVGKQLSSKFVFAHLRRYTYAHTHIHIKHIQDEVFLIEFPERKRSEWVSKREIDRSKQMSRTQSRREGVRMGKKFVSMILSTKHAYYAVHNMHCSSVYSCEFYVQNSKLPQTSPVWGVQIFLFTPKTHLNYILMSDFLFKFNMWPGKYDRKLPVIRHRPMREKLLPLFPIHKTVFLVLSILFLLKEQQLNCFHN